MKKDKIHYSTFSIHLTIGVLLFLFSQCNSAIENKTSRLQESNAIANKQKGAHVFGHLDSTNIQALLQHNLDWITLVPYGDQKDFDSPTMSYSQGDSLRMMRRDSVLKSQINLAHSFGLNVFLKPHIWLYAPSNGKWRSDIFPTNEDNWKLWQKSYRTFIVHFAKIAQQNEVELFCIGTELSLLALEKSDFWESLIREVRRVYSGEITYAANWHNAYEKIRFWEELDYIGIQAYFPLTENKYPSVQQVSNGWNKHLPAIESIHKKYNRNILFTEMGYKSTADSAIKPWEWIEYPPNPNKSFSIETQANCYEAFFDTVWKKDWFAGVHIWQMRSDYVKDNGIDDLDFTPQGKPAEHIIAKSFE